MSAEILAADPARSDSSATMSHLRRSKTVSHASSRHDEFDTLRVHRANTVRPVLQQLPISTGIDDAGRQSLAWRDGPTSPSKRGEASRAYSRQRRLFSNMDTDPSSSIASGSASHDVLMPPLSPTTRRIYQSRSALCERKSSTDSSSSALFSSAFPIDGLMAAYPDSLGFGEEAPSSASSTPSLTSPSSALSRSTSLKSARSERTNFVGARYLSLNGSADLPTSSACGSNEQSMDWTRKARRWSNSMSRKVNIAALNQTIHSTTSPYLRAGLQELRSIFDVESLGLADHESEGDDLEHASKGSPSGSNALRSDLVFPGLESGLGLFGISDRRSDSKPIGESQQNRPPQHQDQVRPQLFESPDMMSPNLSRQSSSQDRDWTEQQPKSPHGFKSQAYEAPSWNGQGHSSSSRKAKSLSVSLLTGASFAQHSGALPVQMNASTSFRSLETRTHSVRPAYVAVGLAAIMVTIVALCIFETSIHPDAASVPLTVFMLAQPAFSLLGIVSLLAQKRWLMDLASRLVRAHVLCQVLISLAALRSLSRSAFYRERTVHSDHSASTLLIYSTPAPTLDPHATQVGSLADQLTYVVVFIVQAALPLGFAFWAQYAVASSLSRVTRMLPISSSNGRDLSARPKCESRTSSDASKSSANLKSATDAPLSPKLKVERKRFNSETNNMVRTELDALKDRRTCQTDANDKKADEGWLGFVITRLDGPPGPASYDFKLDAQDLSKRLEKLAGGAQVQLSRPERAINLDAQTGDVAANTVTT